jgi:general secretion pathway protein D
VQVIAGAASTGQAASAAKEAESLLAKARQAMGEGNLELADSYITRAEKLAPKYGIFHVGDTPKKAREDLQKKLGVKPAEKQKAGLFGAKEPPQDPFAARRSEPSNMPANNPAAEASRGGPANLRLNLDQGPAQSMPATPGSFYAGGQPTSDVRIHLPQDNASAQPPISLSPMQGNGINQIVGPPRPVNGDVRLAPPSAGASAEGLKARAVDLTRQARAALVRGEMVAAEQLALQAQSLVPDQAFGPADDRPGLILSQIRAARLRTGNVAQGVVQAGGLAGAELAGRGNVVRSVYDPAGDTSRNIVARNTELGRPSLEALAQAPSPSESIGPGNENPAAPADEPQSGTAIELMKQGEQALSERNPQRALSFFQQAYRVRDQLDPQARASLQMHLQVLSRQQGPQRPPRPGSLLEGVADTQQAMAMQVAADVTRVQSQAKAMLAKEPKRALETLVQMRHNLETAAQLDSNVRDSQIRRIDMTINETQQFIKANAAQIELDEQNSSVEKAVEAKQQNRIEIDEKMASLVEEFNKLVDEQRYAEAELIAKKARAMDPENPVVVQLTHTSKVLHRLAIQQDIYNRKADTFTEAIDDVIAASIAQSENITFGDRTTWNDLSKRRKELEATGNTRHSERERQIESSLKMPVLLKYDRRPLREVVDDLARLADINIHLDQQGMAIEGVTYETPVSINLSKEISLKSALLLILEPLRMNYVISNDVLKITSGELTNTKVYQKAYPVGDLIIPIPNFVPDGREGISAALEHGYRRAGYGGSIGGFGLNAAPSVTIADAGRSAGSVNPAVNAQFLRRPDMPPATGVPQQIPFGTPSAGPGGLAGGSQADFDALIDLITTTIAPNSWDTVGGPGSVAPFETNLTLVVSQTQEVHEQIADLLQQLRRLQDLQVTIEVRFITLADNFFERIGVDFDFNIDDNFTGPQIPISQDSGRSAVIGLDPALSPALQPTANLDLQFRQGSFNATVPNIPGVGFDPATAGTFGFAILSDIEAFFLISAAQGDTRSNILQAPKVTLFNGQTAFISDTSQRPFVTSIIPVVGDFAAAQQPVIVVLSEGTSLSVQAVVSNDRRFVRLTVVPFFSQIGDVEEFTFTGSKTTQTKSSDTVKAKGDDEASKTKEDVVSEEGTTVQLPTFSFVTVTTTVSVPDGGTVLLGGIKRLNENRTERGLPILSKIPYISRLFKNVGLGRTTSSLMMMVTPRIIIQEEEEEKLIGTPVP